MNDLKKKAEEIARAAYCPKCASKSMCVPVPTEKKSCPTFRTAYFSALAGMEAAYRDAGRMWESSESDEEFETAVRVSADLCGRAHP